MQDADLSRLNKRRREKGRVEFLAHREIILTLTAEQVIASNRGESETERVGRARHHVRAHFRLLPGGATIVCQHWRGDPSLGVTRQRHIVRE